MARKKGGRIRGASSTPHIGENERGEPIPLQTIPAQQPEGQNPRPEILGLPWKDNAVVGETPSRADTDDHNTPPTSKNTGKNPKLSSTSESKRDNAEIPGESIEARDDSYHYSQNAGGEGSSVKDTPIMASPKSHSSADPTVAEILTKLGKRKVGGRIKRVLRKQKPPIRYVPQTVKPTVNDGNSSENSSDDDVVVVSETASRRRTRASAAAIKTKREAAGIEEGQDKSDDQTKLKEPESAKKTEDKGKGKRPCSKEQKTENLPKRRKGVNISEPTQEKSKHKFRVDDKEDSEEEDTPIGFPSMICSLLIAQHPEILKAEDGPGEDAKTITITDKLNSGKRVVDVDMKGVEKSMARPEGEVAAVLIKAYEDEKKTLETDIQQKKLRVTELQAKIQALQTAVTPPNVGPDATSQSPM
ncbi:hypothetical protein LIER_26745 [Lithospermum erythrorhizon]|uniref:Uncharacterized protein n=1 Tax=Lithospermum erythrorhizon TaxID=34254 RepID=A0AAV3RCW5_LITER